MLSESDITQYNRFRRHTDTSVLCHAPFVNLNFDQYGNMTACCYNRIEIFGRYPQDSILAAWQGSRAAAFRKQIIAHKLEGGCSICGEQIRSGNFSATKSRFYDEYSTTSFWRSVPKVTTDGARMPKVVELELSNTCNLSCVMCSGVFSSTIRKNIEQLPPLPMVYDAAFVEQLAELMPGLTDMKFLGGEPFLIDIYYDIWETILRVNPTIRVHITTNGTVLNERAKRILRQLKVGIVLSLDSIEPDTYARIRQGGQLERVIQHLDFFKEITEKSKTYLSIAVCPLTLNWKEIPAILRFATTHSFSIHFNTVLNPDKYAIYSSSSEELQQVISWYESQLPSRITTSAVATKNRAAFVGLIDSLKAKQQEKEQDTSLAIMRSKIATWLAVTDFREPELEEETFRMIMAGFVYFEYPEWKEDQRIKDKLPELEQVRHFNISRNWMLKIIKQKGSVAFSISFLRVFIFLANIVLKQGTIGFYQKVELIISLIPSASRIDIYANDLLEDTVLNQIVKVDKNDEKSLLKDFTSRYSDGMHIH